MLNNYNWKEHNAHVVEWRKLFDTVASLIGDRIIEVKDNSIYCNYKVGMFAYQPMLIKSFEIGKGLVCGDIILNMETDSGKKYRCTIARAFEGKSFGYLRNPEVVLGKLKDYMCSPKNELNDIEKFASEAL